MLSRIKWAIRRRLTLYTTARYLSQLKSRPGLSGAVALQSPLRSGLCIQKQLESECFDSWVRRMRLNPQSHRKYWEWAYMAQALHERDMLRPGRSGLGFAVGQEPLTAMFASLGCRVVPSDLATEEAEEKGWTKTKQHAANLDALNAKGVCPDDVFRDNVSFRHVDMNRIPDDLLQGTFDFCWSSCSMEHLGSIDLGERFFVNSLRCLRPGGVAVHTTEFNLSSRSETTRTGNTVMFLRRDVERMADTVRSLGCFIDIDWSEGDGPFDRDVDMPPWEGKWDPGAAAHTWEPHLKLIHDNHVITSIGLIVEKPS